LYRPFDVGIGYLVFFDEAMSEDRNRLAMEEVQYSIVHVPVADSQFMNPVPKVIGHRTSKLVPKLAKNLDTSGAFGVRLLFLAVQLLQPIYDRGLSEFIAEKDDLGLRQASPLGL
jgi:hypothetical protein